MKLRKCLIAFKQEAYKSCTIYFLIRIRIEKGFPLYLSGFSYIKALVFCCCSATESTPVELFLREIKTGQWPLFHQTASVLCTGSFKQVCMLVVSWEQCWIPAVLVKTSQIEPWLQSCPYNQLFSAHPVTLVTFNVTCIGSGLHCLCKYALVLFAETVEQNEFTSESPCLN